MALSHNPLIATSGLVLALDAANTKSYPGSGVSWYDISGNNNHATLVNSPTVTSGCLVFNGTNQYGTVSHNSTLWNGQTFTLIAGCYKTTATSSRGIVISKDSNYIDTSFNNNGYKIMDSFYNASATQTLFYGNSAVQNAWRIHTYTYNGSSANMYENGIIASTNTISGLLMNTGGSLYLCNYDGGGAYYFGGSVAFFHVYNRALNSGEVLQNFYAVRGRFGL